MSPSPVLYSVGFALSEDGSQVLLLQKGRPAFLAGQWGGVGGHIEEGETPLQAMEREAQEEADLVGVDWQLLEALDRPEKPGAAPDSAKIYMFAARTDLSRAQALTEEPIRAFTWDEVEALPLAQSTQLILEKLKAFAVGNTQGPKPARLGR